MEKQPEAKRITIITILAAVVGFATDCHFAFSIAMIPIILFPKYFDKLFAHPWKTVAQFTATTFCFGLAISFSSTQISRYIRSQEQLPIPAFQIYLILLTIGHYFEFQCVNNFHHQQLTWNTFLIYHSRNYSIGNIFMLAQQYLTKYVFQFSYKDYHPLMLFSLIMAIFGLSLRITAFFTLKNNFTHLLRLKKQQQHRLITHGIYSVLRHPSYTGFFWFTVFSQLFIGNFLSIILFSIVLIKFTGNRINIEEKSLVTFFPEYRKYKESTYILIPFVKDPIIPIEQQVSSKKQT